MILSLSSFIGVGPLGPLLSPPSMRTSCVASAVCFGPMADAPDPIRFGSSELFKCLDVEFDVRELASELDCLDPLCLLPGESVEVEAGGFPWEPGSQGTKSSDLLLTRDDNFVEKLEMWGWDLSTGGIFDEEMAGLALAGKVDFVTAAAPAALTLAESVFLLLGTEPDLEGDALVWRF